MKKNNKWLIASPLMVAILITAFNPKRVWAEFTGLLVFDPTSYATIGHIWHEDVSNGVKLLNTYNEAVKITKQTLDIYNLAYQMSQRVRDKDTWKLAAFAVGNEITEQHYNESINFNAVMNGDVLNAGTAWHQSTLSAGSNGYLGGRVASTSNRMTEYATVQLLDQTSQRCATMMANYKATQDANKTAEDKLKSDTFDQSDVKNASVAILNVISGGSIHANTQARATGNLQACLAEQQTLEAKVQRDRLAHEQLWYADIAKARADSPMTLDPAGTASANQYLEP
jgi:hypothetical protein